MSAPRYVCIHGHFYQPPRENPWLETVENQESAHPYHDWNQRILAECYRPNAASRIVDGAGRIVRIANNYERISFNFGPTLLSWMAEEAPEVYRAILAADRASQSRFSGHGSAMAQAYNHLIMPLASRRDKYTQVRWGIRDFEHRFGRAPEGMWLPETAVDSETLDIMAELGIQFTVLAPKQAARIRRMGGHPPGDVDVRGGRIDPGRVYRATTPSGRHIDLFFYDGGTSNAVAFEHLLGDGRRFAERVVSRPPGVDPVLLHIATDGETYGHHHRHGDMALAFALHYIDTHRPEALTNYGRFRELHPAAYEVEIIEDTAWSCAHGVGRWSRDCSCHTGANPAWNQRWRQPLRESLDWLRDALATVFEERAGALLHDPWAARDDYIDVILDRSRPSADRFLSRHARRELSADEVRTTLQLLEMQRNGMLMFTSCGWFFDDLAGTEGVQILCYAARAIELAGLVGGPGELEEGFLVRLERAESNDPARGDGRQVYDRLVRPTRIDLRRVIAHYAVSSLLGEAGEKDRTYCYQTDSLDLEFRRAGKAKLATGTVRCTSLITRATSTLSFGALHFGDHNLTGGVRSFAGAEAYEEMKADILEAFDRADLIAAQRQLDRHFPELTFSLKSLFRDHQERVLARILEAPLAEAEAVYNQLYSHHAPLMRFLESYELPIPEAFRTAARFVLQLQLRRALAEDLPDLTLVRSAFTQARRVGVAIADPAMDYQWQHALEHLIDRFSNHPEDLGLLERLTHAAEFCAAQHLDIDLWHTQNACYELLVGVAETKRRQAYDGDDHGQQWIVLFTRLCAALRIVV